jgi:hypothetical protein
MTDMDIVEASKRVHRFQKKRVTELGVELTPELVFFHLSEEIGEIARQLVNKNLPVREYEESNSKEEIVQAIARAGIRDLSRSNFSPRADEDDRSD